FKTRWQNARLTAQSQGRSSVLPTGYVAPITITLNGSPNIKIIFSLGGGEFRVSKK
ncbi:MAG: type II secretory pathway, pseudopilin PulG, partial [Leuconostoc pseudomesenteroides]